MSRRKLPSTARLKQLRKEVLAAIRAADGPVSLSHLEGEITAHHSWIRLALESLAADGLVERADGYRGSHAWRVQARTSSDGASESRADVTTVKTAMVPESESETYYGVKAAVHVAEQIRERGGSVELVEVVLREIHTGRDVAHLREYIARRIEGTAEEN